MRSPCEQRTTHSLFLLPFLAALPFLLARHLTGQVVAKGDFRTSSGYTFFAPTTSPYSFLIDNDGKIVRQWLGNGPAAWVVHLLPNGNILRTGPVASDVFGSAAGSGGRIDEFTCDGRLVWTYTLATDKHHRHHDIAPLPNGNILLIAWEVKTAEEAIAAGRDPTTISGPTFWSEAIFEIHPVRPFGGEVVWEWHVWDHLVQDFAESKPNYGNVARHPERMDINFGTQTPDWLHFNSIAYNASLDQIVVSSRLLSEIWVIDHGTSTEEASGHAGGRRGKGGDLLFRWGNPQTYRHGGPASQRLFNQHNAHWIEAGLPGEGNILVFSNGNTRNYPTVEEIAPPLDETGGYHRYAGEDERAVWSYGEQAQPRFLSRTFGGVQHLPNGNTLINVSNEFRLIEVTPEGEMVWEAGIGQAEANSRSGGTFRAVRIPENFQGLRGTDLFRAVDAR